MAIKSKSTKTTTQELERPLTASELKALKKAQQRTEKLAAQRAKMSAKEKRRSDKLAKEHTEELSKELINEQIDRHSDEKMSEYSYASAEHIPMYSAPEAKASSKKKNYQKPKNVFAGLVSWLCMLAFLCLFILVIAFLLAVVFDPNANDIFEYVSSQITGMETMTNELEAQITAAVMLVLVSSIMVLFFRKDRRAFESSLAYGMSKIWIEVKLIAIPLLFYVLLDVIMADRIAVLICAVLIIYLLTLDFGRNGNIFRHNIVHSILITTNYSNEKTPYERLAKRRLVTVVCIILGILAVCIFGIFLVSFLYLNYAVTRFLVVSFIILGISGIIGSVLWYSITQKRDMRDLAEILAQIEEMYSGNLYAVNNIPPTSNFYDPAMQLNMIRTGIEKAVEDGTKADRTKVELITNVSHDIKTPLTSIITYIDLIKKEKDLSPHVKDYVDIIYQKSLRLSDIVQDVFEVSKAATGNIALHREDIDMVMLLKQTLAEMEMTMSKSLLTWRVDIPDFPMMINGDGQKLYRVFHNLIRNCTQYALEGSRAYITLKPVGGQAEFSVRNIAKQELNPEDAENLTERFIRGDQNRSSEGSGLGLSIAKSFTEANGGSFSIKTDGDIFLVSVSLPLIAPTEAAPVSEAIESFEQRVERLIDESSVSEVENTETAEKSPETTK